jgi:hypothetical protein
VGVGQPPSSFPLGGRRSGFLEATGSVLEVFSSLGVFYKP